jgi:hypothetical protein
VLTKDKSSPGMGGGGNDSLTMAGGLSLTRPLGRPCIAMAPRRQYSPTHQQILHFARCSTLSSLRLTGLVGGIMLLRLCVCMCDIGTRKPGLPKLRGTALRSQQARCVRTGSRDSVYEMPRGLPSSRPGSPHCGTNTC